jgi:hypothetical protein
MDGARGAYKCESCDEKSMRWIVEIKHFSPFENARGMSCGEAEE